MSDSPKFEVIDRRKFKAEEEAAHGGASEAKAQPEAKSAPEARPEPTAAVGGPRLVVNEPEMPVHGDTTEDDAADQAIELPPAPTEAETLQQKAAYDGAAERLENIIRAQNPAAGAQPSMTFEALVQQFYVSAMIQMGAGTQEGQRPRIDILGAKTTIDLLGILGDKTKGNLTDTEDRMLQTVLFECRMAFMELTSMISLQGPQTPPVPRK
jgi:hypothetical protein